MRGLAIEADAEPERSNLESASLQSFEEHEAFMSEIQLRGIVDKMAREASSQGTDGDEVMTKNGVVISKFSRDALETGATVGTVILDKVRKVFDLNWGDDAVFRMRNGAPKIMTKFKDKPYSYELLPEYANGSKKFPTVKSMNWEGKSATAKVIRGFTESTPVVQRCPNPRSISRLVIVPKLSPGQAKDDPDHGFRVCVNALINKCIKPDASTIPLAVDEIKKLAHCKYFLQLDGANAYWSIPVCEESMRLTAFHTPDGIFCWNRLLMGAKPSSAVQQSAYLEALDDYIDYYEDGTLRKCLLDEQGQRLRDAEGNLKTLRHKFAVYCDDICAGADTLEELYELFEALICCCKRAGIQVKASKTKFGMDRITFHNYTISCEGTQPKDANLCPIRNMSSLSDVSQVRAFLGCCQQMSQYIKEYGIMAAPLHGLTKKARAFPKPWIKGEDYDLSFNSLRSAILDSTNFLHHKDCTARLFIEVDASDAGWGACAYQMVEPWTGDPADEGRARQGDTGARKVIQWTSKAWTAFELKLPVFYRESLARLLALERYRNLIETNITAGITLYTDHKPGLFENSLSNKGQLSAWRLLETADLLSIVENLYRTGGKMLLADPLSRLCAPSDGFYDVSLPAKVHTLLENLPSQVAECRAMRVSANKDTAAVSRIVQKWRKPTNPISQGKLGSFVEPKSRDEAESEAEVFSMDPSKETLGAAGKLNAFSIGTPHADTGVREIRELILSGKAFAVLTPISLLPQIARGTSENEMDEEIAVKVDGMTKIIMAATADAWLIHLPGTVRRHEVFTAELLAIDRSNVEDLVAVMQDADEVECASDRTLSFSPSCLLNNAGPESRADEHRDSLCWKEAMSELRNPSLVFLYSQVAKVANKKEMDRPVWVQTRAQHGEPANSARLPVQKRKRKSMGQKEMKAVVGKQRQSPLSSWIGKQLLGQNIPKRHLDKDGKLVMMEGYPHGLLAIPSDGYAGQRILVPLDEQKGLIKSTHAEIHHQGHTKVHHVLYPLYYWPGMDATIEAVCTACAKCIRANRRRKKLNLDFNPASQKELLLPRQRYGIDFYGVHNGEILVMVDLFSRETMLEFLPDRKMERVCQAIMKRIIFSRGVPDELRSDNAPELMQGIVRQVCQYLDISQLVTGGHNPRGNAICERVNQTLGAMIRKLSDLDYKHLKSFLPSFEFMINTTLSSATKCTPFEIAHGLPARTIAQARIEAQRVGRGATDPEILEDVSPVFDGSAVKHILEKAIELAEEVKATSEWHRRMSHESLNQKGQRYNLDHYVVGAKVYFYRPPSILDVVKKTRKAKHIDHYVGPATIIKKIGSRSFSLSFINPLTGIEQLLQRDAGMIILKKEWHAPTLEPGAQELAPVKHQAGMELRVGEMVILRDYPDAKDWYVAEISQVLSDRFTVNGYITVGLPLAGYARASKGARVKSMEGVSFLRTWCKDKGKGIATTIPPKHLKGQEKYLWTWRLPVGETDQLLLVRNVRLDKDGCLSKATKDLAATLKFAHHVGAGGEETAA